MKKMYTRKISWNSLARNNHCLLHLIEETKKIANFFTEDYKYTSFRILIPK